MLRTTNPSLTSDLPRLWVTVKLMPAILMPALVINSTCMVSDAVLNEHPLCPVILQTLTHLSI